MNPISSLDMAFYFFYRCEPIENAPRYNHCRFPYYIPRIERDVGTVFYEMPYALLELGFIECCNLLGDCFYSARGVNGRKINNFSMTVTKSRTFISI